MLIYITALKGVYFIAAGDEIMHAAGPRGGRTPAASNLNNQKYSNVIEFIATAFAIATPVSAATR